MCWAFRAIRGEKAAYSVSQILETFSLMKSPEEEVSGNEAADQAPFLTWP